ncbi:MAG: DEAD/DEAH box helicase family protein, partial [Desulfovibrio sp.]
MPPPSPPFELNPAQKKALRELGEALKSPGAETRLLYGVTGSGKTAVYLELARAVFERGQSALLLAPEVALAQKLLRDAKIQIPHVPVFLYNGYQSPQKRERLFRLLAARNSPCVVIGTRSSLFLPLPNPGCIIIDEEHDASFKQDETLPYNAKEAAWYRMGKLGGLLVLGSATPDIKKFYASQNGMI